jgi:hypothetical protein
MMELPSSINPGVPMPNPSATIIQLVSVFASAFTAPTWARVLVLLYGTILAPGRRTVAAALRVLGLADSKHFTNYPTDPVGLSPRPESQSLVSVGSEQIAASVDHPSLSASKDAADSAH